MSKKYKSATQYAVRWDSVSVECEESSGVGALGGEVMTEWNCSPLRSCVPDYAGGFQFFLFLAKRGLL